VDFDLTDEQRLLRDNVARLAQATGRFAASSNGSSGQDRDAWARFAEVGLPGLPFAEADGGFDGGPVETMIVAEALGRWLNLEPFVASTVLAGSILRYGANARQRREIIPGIVEGTSVIAFAHQEPQARYDLSDIVTVARRQVDGWVVNGRKCGVIPGHDADILVVSARQSGTRFDYEGISLFLVDPQSPGVTRAGFTAHDGSRGADIVLSNVRLPHNALIGEAGKAFPLIERAADVALAASFAESVGVMDAMLATTVEYLKTRRQFGKAIGEFQALQHRAADMLVAVEQARSMAIFAASMAEAEDPVERRKAISAAKVQISDSLRFVSQQSVQLHGGIGVTEECAVGPYFKRATILETFLGDCDHHLALFAEAGGFNDPEDSTDGIQSQ
jgi:alkylation response protein AidB-like acyl-CoA dehydrogenase